MLAPFGGLDTNEADAPTIKRYSAKITSTSLHLPSISGASHPSIQGQLLWTEVFATPCNSSSIWRTLPASRLHFTGPESNSNREHPSVLAPTLKAGDLSREAEARPAIQVYNAGWTEDGLEHGCVDLGSLDTSPNMRTHLSQAVPAIQVFNAGWTEDGSEHGCVDLGSLDMDVQVPHHGGNPGAI